jgi:hypothetical protein
MQLLFDRLSNVPTSFERAQRTLAAFQRAYLELRGLLNYFERFKPCMNGLKPTPDRVQDVIGAFVWTTEHADLLFCAAIPFWMVVPSQSIDELRIKRVGSLLNPAPFMVVQDFNPPMAPIYTEEPDIAKQYTALGKDIRSSFKAANPFKESVSGVSSGSVSSQHPSKSFTGRSDTRWKRSHTSKPCVYCILPKLNTAI